MFFFSFLWYFRQSKLMNFSAVVAIVTCVYTWQHTSMQLIPTTPCSLQWWLTRRTRIVSYPQSSLITWCAILLLVCTKTGQKKPSSLLTSWFGITIVWLTLHKGNCFRAWVKVCKEQWSSVSGEGDEKPLCAAFLSHLLDVSPFFTIVLKTLLTVEYLNVTDCHSCC